jgi:hypothetical protein
MQILWQHWVIFLVVLVVGIYIGRKTQLLAGVPLIG